MKLTASWQGFSSELIGTYFLAFTFGVNSLQHTALAPVSVGSILAALVLSTGGVGARPARPAHFNPAVTLGVLLGQRQTLTVGGAVVFISGQLLGALAAGFTYCGILHASLRLKPGDGHSWWAAFIVELVFTAVLVLVVLGATSNKDRHNQYFGLAIGSVVIAAGFAMGNISGCALNPALALGVMGSDSVATGGGFEYAGLFLSAPLLGGLTAAMFHRLFQA
mmetsp:Transcript_56726/g.164306  ORF Transcript_56726/g.164306 Transcript_56726/m.164306 type:complete len:222 (+) Transcript_56726:161-826(+)